VEPDVRDAVVACIQDWATKAGLPVEQLLLWLEVSVGKFYQWRQRFLKWAMMNPDNRACRILAQDGLRSYPASLRELQEEKSPESPMPAANPAVRQQPDRVRSRHVKCRLRAMQGPRSEATACERFRASRRHR
jgi:hypothetical protein